MPIPIPEVVQRFGEWFNDTPGIPTAATVAHLGGMLWSGGLAVAADRTVLAARGAESSVRGAVVSSVAGTHRAVVVGLALVFLSGVAMAAADAETYLGATTFWVKLGLVAVLLANGTVMRRVEARAASDGRAWGRLRLTAGISLACWFLLVLVGVLLMDAA